MDAEQVKAGSLEPKRVACIAIEAPRSIHPLALGFTENHQSDQKA